MYVCAACLFLVVKMILCRNQYLWRTSWYKQLGVVASIFINDKDEIKETIEDFKIDFQNANEAIYIDSVGYSYFNYKLVNRRIWCSGGIPGYWTLVEKTRNRMVLQIYAPEKSTLILTRLL